MSDLPRAHPHRALWIAGVALLAPLLAAVLYLETRPAAPLLVVPEQARVAAAPAPADPSPQGGRSDSGAAATVSPQWVVDTAGRTGVPEAAVRAYGVATLRESREDSSCHLGWTTLAGLGWVESQQGTIDGRTLRADGTPSAPITGPALDGSGDVAAIEGPDGGWARALGPMQFIPSTWEQWAADGDGDGRADPQDIDDAAVAAAHYLCASGGDLATGSGWSAAIYSYNHSADYVRAVYDAAQAYASRDS